MKNIDEIENDVQIIQERNVRVELDKAWEKSWTRRVCIMILTFIVACVWLWVIEESNILLKSIVPVLGYLLSTLSIPQIRKVWIGKVK